MHFGWPLILPGGQLFFELRFPCDSFRGTGDSAIRLSFQLCDQYLLGPDLNHETLHTLMKQMHLFLDFAR